MNRREFMIFLAATGATAAVGGRPAQGAVRGQTDGYSAIFGMWTIDAHAHPDEFYLMTGGPIVDGSSTLAGMRALPMNVSSFAALGDFPDPGGFQKILDQIRKVQDLERRRQVRIIRRSFDLLSTVRWFWFAPGALVAVEGADRLGATEAEVDENLETLYRNGVRMVTIMHNDDNQFGQVMKDRPGKDAPGLTDLGAHLVERLIALGMIVDVAHAHYATLKDVADIARLRGVPIVDSHTSLTPAPEPDGHRLRTWEEMETVAGTGGVVCTWPLKWSSQALQYDRGTVFHWARENYEMKLRLGPDGVGLGTDGGGRLPAFVDGYASILDLPKLADAMCQAGFGRFEVESYMGRSMAGVIRRCLR
jgi:microsomal dipeptidase-like Zn-dependent dipeptidase